MANQNQPPQRVSPGMYRNAQGQLQRGQGQQAPQQSMYQPQRMPPYMPQQYQNMDWQKLPQGVGMGFQMPQMPPAQYNGGMQSPGSFPGFSPMQQQNGMNMAMAGGQMMEQMAPQMGDMIAQGMGGSPNQPSTQPVAPPKMIPPGQGKGISSAPPVRHPVHTAQRQAMKQKGNR